jgi:DNA-binding transcriptional MocR family regulator
MAQHVATTDSAAGQSNPQCAHEQDHRGSRHVLRPDPGDPRLLKNVAQWLTNFYQPADAIAEDRICITGGASQNLACLLQVYTDAAFTRNVWIVAPAYMLSFRIFEDAGFHKKLRAIPEDDQGIDIEYLRQQIKKSEEKARTEGNNEPVGRV